MKTTQRFDSKRATYRKTSIMYTFRGYAEGEPFRDELGRLWIGFRTEYGSRLGAVPAEDVQIFDTREVWT